MAKKKTKKQFMARQRRKGRSTRQAEATWRMMQAQQERFKGYYALNPTDDGERNITTTYEIVTPESAEAGDAEERGWIDDEGESMEPGEYYSDLGSPVDNAVSYLLQHGTWLEPNEYSGRGQSVPARWYTDLEYSDDLRTGARESRSYHLNGFSSAELREINEKYTDAAKRGWSATKWESYVEDELQPNPGRRARRNPDDNWVSYSYGELPPKKVFVSHYRADEDLGSEDAQFGMLLRSEEEWDAVEGTVFEDAIDQQAYFDADDTWEGVKQLKRKWDDGNDAAGDLASSILYTLNIEWI